MGKKLSIITINLNHAHGLQNTIQSVLSQSFSDYEYIIIDGGSTDGSVGIIEQHKDKLSYWTTEKDRGVYHAMNKGILKATGEYCYFLNSGDCLVSDSVFETIFSKSNGEDILYGNMIHGDKKGIEHGLKELRFFDLFVGSIYHQSAFIKRQLFKTLGLYNESLKIVSDWELFLKALFLNGSSHKYIDVEIARYEVGGLSFQNAEFNLSERQEVLNKHFPLFLQDYEELKKYKFSEFAGVFRKIESSSFMRSILRTGLKISRFIKFKILHKSY